MGARAPHPQSLQSQVAGKRKANELAISGDLSEPTNRRPAPGAGSAFLSANASAVTGEHAASCSRLLVFPEGRMTYAAALAVAPLQPSGTFKPTVMDSIPSEPAVSPKTANRRMSSDMSGPLSDMPEGTTASAHVTNTCIQAGQRPNKIPIFISGYVTPVPSWPGCGRIALGF